jgi:hypothetical protein
VAAYYMSQGASNMILDIGFVASLQSQSS